MRKVEIQLSKNKILLGITGSVLFIAMSIYLILISDNQMVFSPFLVKLIGFAGIIFFVITFVYGLIKLFDRKIGLTIDDEGIIDYSSASSVGLIKWSDITEIRSEQISSTGLLLIYVKEPKIYIDIAAGFKRKLLTANYNMYGTPISISSTTLKMKFHEIEEIIMVNFKEYSKKS